LVLLWCRYGRLYAAMQTDGALSFAGFFFTFFIHTAFSIWSAVSPDLVNGQDYAHAGWLPALGLFKGGSKFAGILYMVGEYPLHADINSHASQVITSTPARIRGKFMKEHIKLESREGTDM
jgi:hypothetical protein